MKTIAVVLFSVLLATMAAAQTAAPVNPILGHGTTNFVPVFTSPGRIASSNIIQSAGNIGIGTTTPQVPLHVLSSNQLGRTGTARLPLGSRTVPTMPKAQSMP
jgi:hypothetical protein